MKENHEYNEFRRIRIMRCQEDPLKRAIASEAFYRLSRGEPLTPPDKIFKTFSKSYISRTYR